MTHLITHLNQNPYNLSRLAREAGVNSHFLNDISISPNTIQMKTYRVKGKKIIASSLREALAKATKSVPLEDATSILMPIQTEADMLSDIQRRYRKSRR